MSFVALLAVVLSLDGAWEFQRTNGPWSAVRVPHDWAIAGPFDPDGDDRTGKLPWKDWGRYRRSFEVAADALAPLRDGGRAYLEFDGVMARPHVTLNGKDVGGWGYGYMSFALDVTGAVLAGTNRVEVTADTRDHDSRWYPGGGLYRSVRLVVKRRDQVKPYTLFLRAESVEPCVAKMRVTYETVGGEKRDETFSVERPHLWSPEDPYLYTRTIADETFRYGIRTAVFTADDGFHLNGKRLQLRGVNLHSDLGPLGMAFDRDAMKRQLLAMKDMGANAIRTSHNAPAPQLLDLCDEMGFVVWDECFDKWDTYGGKRPEEKCEDYVSANLRQFVRRDRNHPCVVLWSIGNEIWIQTDTHEDGTSAARSALFRSVIRELDTTRPVGMGCCHSDTIPRGDFDPLDVTGWNYNEQYNLMRAHKPDQPVVYSESASALSEYGYYPFPFEGNAGHGNSTHFDFRRFKVDGYDHLAAKWSDIPDAEFKRMARDRYCAGEFVWTGIDYLGEPTPYLGLLCPGRPNREMSRSSYFGIMDLCVIPKDRFWLYRSHWNAKKETVHLVPSHWNFNSQLSPFNSQLSTPNPQHRIVPVYVYTSGDSAELFLNGKSLGTRRKGEAPEHPACLTNAYYDVCAKYRLRWFDVAYAPGELKAVAYRHGRKIGETSVRTSGKPIAVRLTDDPYNAPEAKTRFIQVDLVDANGVHDALSTARVSFALEGPGEIESVGNGDPRGLDSFKKTASHPLYFGKAVVVVRRTGKGDLRLTASVPGLRPATLMCPDSPLR